MSDCIIGEHIGAQGYARVTLPSGERKYAHRVVWEQAHGPIPEGHVIHHRCEVKACINLGHLEVMPRQEHPPRHRRCDHDNRYVYPGGGSYCRTCCNARVRRLTASNPEFRARENERQRAKRRRRDSERYTDGPI